MYDVYGGYSGFAGEFETLKEAKAFAQTLGLAHIDRDDEEVALVGGAQCRECGELVEFSCLDRKGICDGCFESARDREECDRQNAADFDRGQWS